MNFEWLFVLFGLMWVVGLAFWIWALVDCIQVQDDSMYQSGTKLVWVLVIVFLNWVGALIYLVAGRPKRPISGQGPGPSPSGPPSTWGQGPPGMPPPPGP